MNNIRVRHFARYGLAASIGIVIASFSFALPDQPADTPAVVTTDASPQKHTWNLENADILSVINTVSKETGKNFIIDPRVTGKINLVSSVPLNASELYQVFLSLLEVYGFSAVPSGDVVKIIPIINAAKEGGSYAQDGPLKQGEQIIVRVVPVHNISAAQIMNVLRPLVPQWSYLSAYNPTNILILSGSASNVNRLIHIIDDIDQASSKEVDIIQLKTANAGQVAELLKALDAAAASEGTHNKASVVADEKNNRLLVSGERMARLRSRALIAQLDMESVESSDSTRVVYLHYLKAKDFAPILEKTAQGSLLLTQKSNPQMRDMIKVQAEESTNSLIVSAPPSLIQGLERVIARLDVRPAQVLVQAVIVELSASATEKLGIQWGTSSDSGVADTFQGGIGTAVIRSGSFRILISAIEGISSADILSEPTIVVLDNKQAKFYVGKEVSIINSTTGAGTGSSATGIPFTTSSYSRQKVGLAFDVTPQIGQGQTVQLLIHQKNDTLQNPDDSSTTPIVNDTSIETSVIVNSGDILVMGGLMNNNLTDSINKTPILSSIPFIGKLFNLNQRSMEKKNLLVFIRPIILRTPTDGTQVSEERYEQLRRTQQYWHENWLKDTDDPAERELPPRRGLLVLPLPFQQI